MAGWRNQPNTTRFQCMALWHIQAAAAKLCASEWQWPEAQTYSARCGGICFCCRPPPGPRLPPELPPALRPRPRPRPLLPCCWRAPTSCGGRKWGA